LKKLIIIFIFVIVTNLQSNYVNVKFNNEINNVNIIYSKIKGFLSYKYKKNKNHVNELANIINYMSIKYDIDKNIIFSIIKYESSFNEHSVSYKGARGLMQVMWSVWGPMLKENNICNKEHDLHDKLIGINAGCFVLKYYIDRYGLEKALQKYFGRSDYASIYSTKILKDI